MAKKKAAKRKGKRAKKGKLTQIKKHLDDIDKLCDLLDDCGFDTNDRTYTPASELRSHAEEINHMFVKLLGDRWWRLQQPAPKSDAKE